MPKGTINLGFLFLIAFAGLGLILSPVFFLIILFTAVVIEWAAGRYFLKLTTDAQRRKLAILQGEVNERNGLPMQPHPYMLYVNTPHWMHNGIQQTNLWGHRNQAIAVEKPQAVLRILCLGGSTTYGYLLDRPEDAWPLQLQALLTKQLNRPVEVINAGLNYGTSAEMLTHYVMRQRHFKPDVVILHEGGNDAAPLILDDYDPEYQGLRMWSASTLKARPGEKNWLKYSAALRVLYANWLGSVNLSTLIFEENLFTNLTVEHALQNAQLHYPLGYERNLDTLLSLIKADNALPILFPFVMAPQTVFEVLPSEMTYAKRLYPAIMIGVRKHEQIMRLLADKYQLPLVELGDDAIPLTAFFDHCHLKPEGESIKAHCLATLLKRYVQE